MQSGSSAKVSVVVGRRENYFDYPTLQANIPGPAGFEPKLHTIYVTPSRFALSSEERVMRSQSTKSECVDGYAQASVKRMSATGSIG